MQYTQSQVRNAIGAGEQTMRYWKRVLPFLKKKSGKSALFSAGEMLALSVINQLVQAHKMDISVIGPISDDLFSICSRPLLFSRHHTLLWIDLKSNETSLVTNLEDLPTDRMYVVIPISKIWEQINTSLVDAERPGEQRELLPLASVR